MEGAGLERGGEGEGIKHLSEEEMGERFWFLLTGHTLKTTVWLRDIVHHFTLILLKRKWKNSSLFTLYDATSLNKLVIFVSLNHDQYFICIHVLKTNIVLPSTSVLLKLLNEAKKWEENRWIPQETSMRMNESILSRGPLLEKHCIGNL